MDYLRQALPNSATVALFVIIRNALFLMIWYVLLDRRRIELGRLARCKIL
jgi:hypothetical protein